jgi:DNA processing protein
MSSFAMPILSPLLKNVSSARTFICPSFNNLPFFAKAQMNTEELSVWLRLSLTDGVGNDAAQRLLAHFGSPEAVFEQPACALHEVVSSAQADALLEPPLTLEMQLALTQHWLAQSTPTCERAVWCLGDALYPAALLSLSDPPLMLYAQGQLSWPLPPTVAVVGSRNPTPQGAQTAEQLSETLARAGLCVVSGLALGVDGAAHRGALQSGSSADVQSTPMLRTIAVVGTGLDRVYPRQHHALAQAITQHGWLLSEYPLGTPPLAHHFPRRNRLIAALGLGTLVVEAAMQSGSLITAQLALELGREVMAIPGSIHAPQSRGCHALIQEGAKLVETAQDVLEELPPLPTGLHIHNNNEATTASPEHPLLAHMGHVPVSLDALQTRSAWDAPTLLGALLSLELEGVVARLPGGLYQRLNTL